MTQARAASINTAISDQDVMRERNHVELMKRAHLWSYGNQVLPLTRGEELGMMVNVSDAPPFRVYLGNVFAVALGSLSLSAAPFIDYDSAEAAVADGWEVN